MELVTEGNVSYGNLGVNVKIILKWSFEKWTVRVCSGFNWLSIRAKVDCC